MKKTYTSEFKAKVVLELLREEMTISQLASKHEIHPTQLRRWEKTVLEGMRGLFDEKGKKDVKEKEDKALIQELYAQIGELTTKMSWLKKKSGIDI